MATCANSTSVSAREVMRAAWRLYRKSVFAAGRFDRQAFGQALLMAWGSAKAAAERTRRDAEENARYVLASGDEAEFSPMEQAIHDLSYLPFGMNAARHEREIRARYALAA